jgi:hypothetical protein
MTGGTEMWELDKALDAWRLHHPNRNPNGARP